ncbi:FolC bifunctional protein [Dichomitus squalens]|uniref:Folylpolyglutamate synthase n=1 Tax=Dichomitus squalens TaxID=114155 RepID=A0A4Q9P8R1_9APHY|nr:FolC bifunctional protein [Dichomitus squalens]TBU59131.1 FolC bifunctional protein [Dichomitus squalens]
MSPLFSLSYRHLPVYIRLLPAFLRRTMSTRTYRDAVDHLNSLQSNAATLEAVRASGGRLSEFAIPEMIEYLGRIGYSPSDLNKLNVIHITGTKGKGSTSAFTDSVLRATRPEWKVGLYTSPHLVSVRERIRINGSPVDEETFVRSFFEVWDRLQRNTKTANPQTSIMPGYFRFMTLLAYHIFLELKVDATILEVGVGGRHDSTNIVPKPIVTGITALGIDHVNVLGNTLKDIAWQKAGIFKEGVPALTVEQPEEAAAVLKEQADIVKVSEFEIVQRPPGLPDVKLGLSGSHQYQNAKLAVALAKRFLSAQALQDFDEGLPEPFVRGLEATKWPGRCQTVVDPKSEKTTWFLDGAHTLESLDCCMRWYVSPDIALRDPEHLGDRSRVLIFNCTSGRSGKAFLGAMLARAAEQLQKHGLTEAADALFDQVVFCANVTYADGTFKGDITTVALSTDDKLYLKTQHELADTWSSLVPSFPKDNVHVLPSIEHAVNVVRKLNVSGDKPVDVLVAGSLHLVGGVIEVAGLSDVAL